jgi:ABC-type phosphate transport system substrate-binding protein
MYRLIIIAILLTGIFCGCNNNNYDTPTKGKVIVEVDDAVYPIVQSEKNAFDSLYKNVSVELKKVTPLEGMVNIINSKSKMLVGTRYFNKNQSDFISKQNIDIKTFKFCYDAIAIVGSKSNTTNHIRVDEIRDALLGINLNYSFILPQTTSGTFLYLKEEVLNGQDPKNAVYASTDEEVLKKVEKSRNLLGIVSLNTVQDSSKIKFIEVGQLEQKAAKADSNQLQIDYFTPHPGYVYKDYYPMKQTVYIFLNDITLTSASGFTTFLTSYEGQKIALGQNLTPAAVPVKINAYQ